MTLDLNKEIKVCRNRACPRLNLFTFVGFGTTYKFCQSCKSKMKQLNKRELAFLHGGHIIDSIEDTVDKVMHPQTNSRGELVVFKKPPDAKDMTFACAAAIEGCPIADPIDIHMPASIWGTFRSLAMRNKLEWFSYLRGGPKEDKGVRYWEVTDYYFPKQKVSHGHCEPESGTVEPGTCGSIHSHNTMGAFFSTEDQKHFNHPVEMVINAKGEWKAVVLTRLKCGENSRVPANLLLTDPNGYDAQSALEAAIVAHEPEPQYQRPRQDHIFDTTGPEWGRR